MQDAKEEVRARLNIEDVIGEYVQLRRAGRNFKGLSPFTSEKTPSFVVSPDKQIWHDFSSNKGGDLFSFVMEVEGMDFRAALEHLARKAGVDLSLFEDKGSQQIAKLKKRLLAANDLAANYYQQSLIKNDHAIEYVFKARSLSKAVVQNFRIGYAPSTGDALTQFLLRKDFTKQELSQAGLVNRFGGDLFRGRIIIPLMDATGQIIGFTGRILIDEKNAPKYLNTPQTLLYDKGRHVFGLSQAKEAIRTNNYAVIVEGNLDVVSSHQADVTQTVATGGTAMTENHLKALSRLTNNIRLAFDGDSAGLAATERAVLIAQNVGVELTIIPMPDGAKDPDELIKQDAKLWQQAIETSIPAIDWVIKQYAQREDLASAAGKRRFTSAALNLVRALHDSVEQDHYVAKIAALSDASTDAIRAKLQSAQPEPDVRYKKVVQTDLPATDNLAYQDNLLSLALTDAQTHKLFKKVNANHFSSEQRQTVAKYLLEHGGKPITDTPPLLKNLDTYVKILLLKADARYAGWNDSDRNEEAARMIRQITTEHNKMKKEKLTNDLRDAEELGNDARADEIRTKLNKLIKETI